VDWAAVRTQSRSTRGRGSASEYQRIIIGILRAIGGSDVEQRGCLPNAQVILLPPGRLDALEIRISIPGQCRDVNQSVRVRRVVRDGLSVFRTIDPQVASDVRRYRCVAVLIPLALIDP
jgi:hypothetical protein